MSETKKNTIENIVSGLSGVAGIVSSAVQNATLNTEEADNAIEAINTLSVPKGSLDTVTNMYNNQSFAKSDWEGSDFTVSTKEGIGNIFNAGLSGISAGSTLGVPGAIALGGAGMLAAGATWLDSTFKAKNKANTVNRLSNAANQGLVTSTENAIANTIEQDNYNFMKSLLKYGGPLFNHGGDWSNGLTFINEGGLHEQNPLGGVPVGIDSNFTPNLVEEGEIIWNDYVFSNRLKPTKKQLEAAGFDPKYEGYTFAKIVEDIQKVSAENPLDKISTDTLNENLMYLMTMQEEIRMKKEAKKNKFDLGGPTDSTAIAIENLANQIAEEQYYKYLGYPNAEVGKRIQKEQKYTKAINGLFETLSIENTLESILSRFSKKEKTTGRNKKESNKFKYGGSKGNVFVGTGDETNILGHLYETPEEAAEAQRLIEEESRMLNEIADAQALRIMADLNPVTTKTTSNTDIKNPFVNAGTIAPLISSAGQLIYNTLKPIDKSNVIAAKAYSKVPMMSLPRVGGKKSFTPTDKNQYISPIIAQGNSTARTLQNQDIDPRGALLVNNYNTQRAIAEALNAIDQADFAKEMQVGQFNLGIDQANLNASQAEQNANIIRANKLAEAELKDAQTIEALGQLKGQAINASLNTLTKGIADLATQGINWNLIKNNPAYADAIKHVYRKEAKCGGMLTRKKRRK